MLARALRITGGVGGQLNQSTEGLNRTWAGCIGFHSRGAVLDDISQDVVGSWTDLDAVDPGTPLAQEPFDCVVLAARTIADLRRAVSLGGSLPSAARVRVIVARTPEWAAQPLPIAGQSAAWRRMADLRVTRKAQGWHVDAVFAEPVPGGDVLTAVANGFAGTRRHMAQPVIGLAGEGAAHWRPGDPNVTLTSVSGPVPDRRDALGCDLVLRVRGPRAQPWTDERIPSLDRPPLPAKDAPPRPDPVPGSDLVARPDPVPRLDLVPHRDLVEHPDFVPPVDESVVNPIGFVPYPRGPIAVLAERPRGFFITGDSKDLVRLPPTGALTDVDVARLRDVRGVVVPKAEPHGRGHVVTRIVAGLAAGGVPVLMDVDAARAAALGTELAAALAAVKEELLASDLHREELSVVLRRCALRTHGAIPRWRSIAASAGLSTLPERTVSVLLCTRRKEMIPFALEQMERQRGVTAEVVVGLHGFSAREAGVEGLIADSPLRIALVEAGADVPFGELLNRMAVVASGSFLAKVDDDDWYGPEHLADLVLAQLYSGADLVGSAAEFVYLEPIGVTVRRRMGTERFSPTVAGGTMLMTRGIFEAVGGFRPIPRTVDGQLLEAVEMAGGRIYRTHGLNYVLRRRNASGHTWRQPVHSFLKSYRQQWRGLFFNKLMESSPTPHVGYRRQGR